MFGCLLLPHLVSLLDGLGEEVLLPMLSIMSPLLAVAVHVDLVLDLLAARLIMCHRILAHVHGMTSSTSRRRSVLLDVLLGDVEPSWQCLIFSCRGPLDLDARFLHRDLDGRKHFVSIVA